MLQVFINGPPGAGKTTLCKLLCAELRLEHLATGDLLKDNIAQRTELGRTAKQCITAQQLVPDHVVVDMVAERVLECNLRDQGWVLDGFPRTVEQCAALRRKMISPSVVLLLELPERECTKRITGRRFDATTGRIYHLPNVSPHDPAVLARLTKRGDDTTTKLAPRFEAYASYGEQTNAQFSGVAHRIDAVGKTPDELLEDVLALLHSLRPVSSHSHSHSGNSAMTLRGNQQSMQQAQCSGAVARGPRYAARSPPQHQYRSQQQSLKHQVPPLQQQHQLVPQTIDEDDDEDDARSIDLQEYHYDCDESDARAAGHTTARLHTPPRASRSSSNGSGSDGNGGSNSWKRSLSSESSSSSALSTSRSSSSHGNNNSEELPSPSAVAATSAGASSTPFADGAADRLVEPLDTPAAAALASPWSALPTSTLTPPGVDIAKFKDMLLDGFEVLKHGRRGSPHVRLIYTDLDFKRIFWQKATAGSSGGKDAKNKTKRAKLDQSLVLADVVQVVRGIKTDVLKRTGDVTKYERYLSLIADDRTLDMELRDDATCDLLVRGFDVLLHGGGSGR